MPATRTFVRPVKTDIIRIGSFVALSVVACMHAQAENGTWNWFTEGYTNGLSVEAAADWNDTANWVDGIVPSDENPTAYIVPSTQNTSMASHPARWIKVPDSGISLGYFSTRRGAKVRDSKSRISRIPHIGLKSAAGCGITSAFSGRGRSAFESGRQ